MAKEGGKKGPQMNFTEADVDVANAQGTFEEWLFKKMRGSKKKIKEIEELEDKIKGGHKANDAQKEKLASRVKVEAEYNDLRSQASAYFD